MTKDDADVKQAYRAYASAALSGLLSQDNKHIVANLEANRIADVPVKDAVAKLASKYAFAMMAEELSHFPK